MYYVLVCILALFIAGCQRPQSGTPAEEEAQEERMRAFLNDSSPRNMNQQPKAVPEFRKNIDFKRSSKDNDDKVLVEEQTTLDELTDPY